jgi:hypothetical protein
MAQPMTNLDPGIWTAGAFLACSAAFALNWRGHLLRFVISVLIVYGYWQLSSLLFWLPYYKDGGNGTLDDRDLWLVQSVVLNILFLAIAKAVRAFGSSPNRQPHDEGPKSPLPCGEG